MEPQSVPLSKQQKQWNRQVQQHLDRYSNLRDWSELASWLSKLKNLLFDYKGTVMHKESLLKRLATSLNGNLPVALHESTLEIYQILFTSMITIENLQMACIGLFSFYTVANLKNKQKVIQLFFKYFPNFGSNLKLLTTGLLITILPSLNEMHEPLVKDVTSLIQLLSKPELIGQQILAETVWIAILRSPSCRGAGLKYISSKLGKDAIEQDNDQQDNFWNQTTQIHPRRGDYEETFEEERKEQEIEQQIKKKDVDLIKIYCPKIDKLVVNSLVICIQDTNILAIKAALDFLYKYLPLKSEHLCDKIKQTLSRSVIWLLGKRDMSVTRKINLWLFGKPDNQNRYNINQKNLKFINCALVEYLKIDNSIDPLKIIFNLYSQHEQLSKMNLEKLAKDIINFCYKQQNNSQVNKLMHRLIERGSNNIFIFSSSLGSALLKEIQLKKFRQAQRILNLILFLVNKILKTEELNKVIFQVLSTIIKSYMLNSWQDHDYMKNSLKNAIQIMDKYKQPLKQTELREEEIKIFDQHNRLYAELIEIVKSKEKEMQFQEEIHLINKIIVKVEEIFGISNSEWINNLINNIHLNNPHHYLSPLETIGQNLEKQTKLKIEIIKLSEDTSKNNSIKVSLSKIWSILSLGHLQNRLIPLLIRLVKFFPHYFQSLLETQFYKNTEMTIIKFTLFWHTGPKNLNIITQDQLEEVSKPGLFKMLEYLDTGNPLVKYNSNIWINECVLSFHRILNPLLEIMLKPKQFWYKTIQGQYIYAINPDSEKTLKIINYLKSIIKHTGDRFNKIAWKTITGKILPYYQIFKGNQVGNQQHQTPYITVILELIIRFTETKYASIDNPGIDLAACELLEVLIKSINTPQLSNYLLKNHTLQLLNSLHFATINEDHLLQIQIINLFRIIFIESNVRRLADNRVLKEVISNYNFPNTILEGLNSNFPYIKERFVEFINYTIPLFLQYHNNCSQIISRILNTYSTKISVINSKKMEILGSKDLQISKNNAQILILLGGIKEVLSHFLSLQIKPFEKQKNQNDTDSGVFSLYSWKSFVDLKIERKTVESGRGKKNVQEIAKQVTNQLQILIYVMTSCWTLSDLLPYYKLSWEGLQIFDYEQFITFNKQLYLAQGKYETEKSIESFIIDLMRVLINNYPSETVNAMVSNWATAKNVEIRLKIVEILIFSSIPLEYFYSMLADSINSEKIGKKRKVNTMQFQKSAEQDILNLCQVYTHYNFQNFSVFQSHNLLTIWMSFSKFLKIFENTKNVQTLFAMIQLLDLFVKKNNPKQIIKDQKLKKEITGVISCLHDLMMVCAGKIKITTQKNNIDFRNYLPLPSSIFDQYSIYTNHKNQSPIQYLIFDTISSNKGIQYLRIYAFMIAKRVTFNLLSCFHNQTEINLIKKIREVVVYILPIVQDKEQNSQLVEHASEFVLTMLQKKPIFLKQLKNEILHIFNKEDFFICTSKTLQSWAKIIDLIIDNNKDHDIFNEYLQKVSLQPSIFSSYSLQTKKKIKSFERICFILYSGKKDKYNDKAHLLIDKIIDVIKNSEAPQPVLIMIFFCIRILILRMSPQKLTKLLSGVWQMIIFLLMNIFNDESQKNRLNLLWAALKLIEMVSLMQICEFHCHQWMFFYDFVGVKFGTKQDNLDNELKLSFKPKINKFLSPDIELYRESQGLIEQKRHVIIKEDKIDDIELLKTKALLLSSYLIANNEVKMKFDMKQVEELINNDFLNLDEFIFKFK